MIELDLLGVGADGQSLVLTDAGGERYVVPITDDLRGAVRRDRPRPDASSRSLRPRDIQALLRSGLTPDDIARQYDADVEHIRRFEAPVLAEQQWVLARVRDSHVGGDPEAPVMGDLVVDRLAARGVDPASLAWSARRGSDGPWEIALTFVQGAAEHAAHWTFSPSGEVVEALDQEGRWLTETVAAAPTSAIFTPLPRPTAPDPDDRQVEDLRVRDALLDQLNAARGHRQDLDLEEDDDADADPETGPEEGADSPRLADAPRSREGAAPSVSPDVPTVSGGPADARGGPHESISARIYSLAHARTRPAGDAVAATGAGRTGADDDRAPAPADPATGAAAAPGGGDRAPAQTLPGLEALGGETPAEGRPERKRSRRRSVPSWDEIVFGSRPS